MFALTIGNQKYSREEKTTNNIFQHTIKNMVEAQGTGNNPPRAAPMVDEGDSLSSERLQWTAQLVSNVDKKLRASVSVDELKKLCLNNAAPEFKKVL